MGSVIDYTEGTSFLHKANPVAKLVFALELFVAAFAAQGTLEVLAVLAHTHRMLRRLLSWYLALLS